MEVLGNVDSAQDSRGQRSRDRAFDFNIFASELFSKVEVEKTFQASQNEGGLAGTVGLFTGRPFDYPEGSKGALVLKLGTNEYTKDAQPRVAALFSRNWDDKFGVSVSLAYGKRETTEQGHNTYNYSDFTGDDIQGLVNKGLDISHLSSDMQAKLLDPNQRFYFADGNRVSSWNAKQERLGITTSFQWRPTPKSLLTLDVLHGEFTTHRDELHFATRPLNGGGSTTLGGAAKPIWPAIFQKGVVLNKVVFDKNNYATYTDASNVIFGSEHRRELNENRFNQVALTGNWDITDRIEVDGHIGYEKSTYRTPYDDKLYMRAVGNLVADYGSNGRSAYFSYPNTNLTDPSIYAMDNFYYRGFNNGSELKEGVANIRYDLSDVWTLKAGLAYHRFEQDGIDMFYDGGANGTTGKTRGTSVADITYVFSNSFGKWLVGDYPKAFAKYKEYHRFTPNKIDGVGGALQDIENVYKTSEATVSEYAQADWKTEIFGKRFRGNIGLRGYQTDTQSQGWIQGDSYAYLGTANVKGHYTGVLPALNTVLDLTPELLLRFSATQNINRPGLSSMAARGSAFQDPDTKEITASRGNPNLKPYKDTSLDLSVEYYFARSAYCQRASIKRILRTLLGLKPCTIFHSVKPAFLLRPFLARQRVRSFRNLMFQLISAVQQS
jgi:iron complex outermembrane receptor protein